MRVQSMQVSRRVATATMLISLALVMLLPSTTFAAWGSWKPAGGTISYGPDAVSYNNRLYVFGWGAGDGVYVKSRTGSVWSDWSAVPGGFAAALSPTTVVYQGNLWLFARKSNEGAVYRNIYDGVFWSGWAKVPLPSSAKPAEVEAVVFNSRIWLFVRDITTSGSIYRIRYDGTAWSSYGEVPGAGRTNQGPSAVVYNKRLWLFVAGTDDFLYRNIYNGSAWKGWSQLPGAATTISAPGSASFGGKLWLFIRAKGTNRIYRRQYTSSWGTWAEVPGNGFTNAGPSAAKYNDRLWLFVQGTDGAVWFNRF